VASGDVDGAYINAHGGGVYFEDGYYYWVGERRETGDLAFPSKDG
jgi:hypothetical protein